MFRPHDTSNGVGVFSTTIGSMPGSGFGFLKIGFSCHIVSEKWKSPAWSNPWRNKSSVAAILSGSGNSPSKIFLASWRDISMASLPADLSSSAFGSGFSCSRFSAFFTRSSRLSWLLFSRSIAFVNRAISLVGSEMAVILLEPPGLESVIAEEFCDIFGASAPEGWAGDVMSNCSDEAELISDLYKDALCTATENVLGGNKKFQKSVVSEWCDEL
jgi:hypothetical protein